MLQYTGDTHTSRKYVPKCQIQQGHSIKNNIEKLAVICQITKRRSKIQ